MEAWQNHMPPGMCLKSYGECSNLFDPESSFTLEDFSHEKGLNYHPSNLPVKLETFIAYGRAFQERFVPKVEPKRLVALNATDCGYELSFDNAETVSAKHVVLAIGVVPFKHTPSSLAHLPATLASHSSDYGEFDRLEGQEVTVLGSGSSALDIAALLSMRGAAVNIVARSPLVISRAHRVPTRPFSGGPSFLPPTGSAEDGRCASLLTHRNSFTSCRTGCASLF